MKALVHDGNGHIALEDRPEPQLQLPTDAIIRVTRSTICTSDLHIIHGAVPRAMPNTVLGHEFVGVVEQAGEGVRSLKPGNRVAVSCETFCGECFYCERGWVNNCVEGGWELGCCEDGCQAELVRVAHADRTCAPIPAGVTDEDALFLGDIVATGHWGASIAEIEPGSTVAGLPQAGHHTVGGSLDDLLARPHGGDHGIHVPLRARRMLRCTRLLLHAVFGSAARGQLVWGQGLQGDRPLVVGGVDLLEGLAPKRVAHARRSQKRRVIAVECTEACGVHATERVSRDPLHGEPVDHLSDPPTG